MNDLRDVAHALLGLCACIGVGGIACWLGERSQRIKWEWAERRIPFITKD